MPCLAILNNGNLYHFPVNATRDGFDLITPGLSALVAANTTELQEVILGTGFCGITDLKVGPDGLLYVLSFGQGKIFVISRQFPNDHPVFVREQYLDFLDREPDPGGFLPG